ncbi:MAG: SdpI family protein [Candidatus Hydrogenedentes bacterium]|nr:SdpI family protein [Candidatus Hydrogenedentota bacterium]
MTAPPRLSLRPILLMTAVFLVPMLLISVYAWSVLPVDAQIPTHWNARGEVDDYSSKSFGLFFLPLLLAAIVPGIALLVRIDPRRHHVEQSQKFLVAVSASILFVMAVIHTSAVLVSLGYPLPMDRIVATSVGLLFLLLGNFLGKVRSNFFMGVRTPWTLSSELSWNKTHRLAGKLFFAVGLLTILLALIANGPLAIGAMLVSLLAATLITIVYSYVVWKSDPVRLETPNAQ